MLILEGGQSTVNAEVIDTPDLGGGGRSMIDVEAINNQCRGDQHRGN